MVFDCNLRKLSVTRSEFSVIIFCTILTLPLTNNDKSKTNVLGEQGSAGSQGIQGLKGDQGVSGSNGAKGEPGLDGPFGPQGLKGDQGAM